MRAYAEARLAAIGKARVVLAASGGGDSTAMVALLCEGEMIDPRRAVIAHFDHRLRGAASSARDAGVIAALAARYEIDLVADGWCDPQHGEAAAREARYAFLARVAQAHDAAAVITGHTADDQAETVLMHAMRGAGLHGLAGMAADGAWPVGRAIEDSPGRAVRLWRPLLAARRDETRAYCAARALPYADDPTNSDRASLRNRVRLDLLPRIEHAKPGARDALLRIAEDARLAANAIDAVASMALPADLVDDDAIALSRPALAALPPDVLPHAFRLALVRLLSDARDIERRHYALLAHALSAATGSTFELPRRVVVTVDASEILLSVGPPRVSGIAPDFERPLPFAGTVGAWDLAIEPDVRAHGGAAIALPAGAVVRGRRPGDRLRPRGLGGTKKLHDYYIDRKLPRRLRDATPVIAHGSDVLWTPLGPCEAENGEPYVVRAALAGQPPRIAVDFAHSGRYDGFQTNGTRGPCEARTGGPSR